MCVANPRNAVFHRWFAKFSSPAFAGLPSCMDARLRGHDVLAKATRGYKLKILPMTRSCPKFLVSRAIGARGGVIAALTCLRSGHRSEANTHAPQRRATGDQRERPRAMGAERQQNDSEDDSASTQRASDGFRVNEVDREAGSRIES